MSITQPRNMPQISTAHKSCQGTGHRVRTGMHAWSGRWGIISPSLRGANLWSRQSHCPIPWLSQTCGTASSGRCDQALITQCFDQPHSGWARRSSSWCPRWSWAAWAWASLLHKPTTKAPRSSSRGMSPYILQEYVILNITQSIIRPRHRRALHHRGGSQTMTRNNYQRLLPPMRCAY